MGASRGWSGNITLPTGRHTLAVAVPAPDASGNSPASIPVYIDGENAGSLFATVGKHNASVSFQRPLVINERGVYAGGATFNEFEIALSRILIFNFDMSAEGRLILSPTTRAANPFRQNSWIRQPKSAPCSRSKTRSTARRSATNPEAQTTPPR